MTLLVEAGANINYVKPNTKFTPLHWAAFNNDMKVVLYLLTHGARLLLSFMEETPLEVAGSADNEEVRILFLMRQIVYTIINYWWKAQKSGVLRENS